MGACDPMRRAAGVAALSAAVLICGCGSGARPSTAADAAASRARATPTTDPQNLFDCLARARAAVSTDPSAAPRRFISGPTAVRAARDGAAALAARFADGTRAEYDVWSSTAEAVRERGRFAGEHAGASAPRAEAHGNVVVVYRAARPYGRAAAVTTECVPG